MKSGTLRKWNLGVGLFLVWTASHSIAEDQAPGLVESTNRVATAPTNAPTVAEKPAAEPSNTNNISTAPVELVSTVKTLPAGIRPSSPVAEIIKLANSGVEEGVMMAFVTNSMSTFNLGAEEIIYLKDIGVPDAVVSSMILRDQDLRTQYANAASAASAATPWMAPPENAGPPPAEQVAPQPEPGMEPPPAEPAPPPTEVADNSSFYSDLAPYGNWVNVSGYGTCWQPNVVALNPGWQPYYNCGRWVWSDCGWYWCSDYSWGWAPFHYGRWFHHSNIGWCWAPDHVWGPSWVCWRYTDNYCGWAPLPPGSAYTAGGGMHYNGHPASHSEEYGLRPEQYRFVTWNNFRAKELPRQRMAPAQNERLFRDSTVASSFKGEGARVTNDGLAPERVSRATHVQLRTTQLRDAGELARSPGRAERFDPTGKTLTVYRPQLPNSAPSAQRSASALSAPSAPSAPSSGSHFYPRPAGDLATVAHPGSDRPLPTPRGTPAETLRTTPAPSSTAQNPPLILHGAQPSASLESAPRSSLVIIGRRTTGTGANQTYTTYSTPRPGAAASVGNANTSREPLAWNNTATPWAQSSTPQNANSSPAQQPVFVPRNNSYGNYERPVQTYRPSPNYQAPMRSAPAEAPRYTPAPANTGVPRPSSPQAVAPAARPAPSAPAPAARPPQR